MVDTKKPTKSGAVELSEKDLEKAQGGFAKYDSVDGEIMKKKKAASHVIEGNWKIPND